ncbi:MAG: HlyD family secretion protein [Methylovirgula sp.]
MADIVLERDTTLVTPKRDLKRRARRLALIGALGAAVFGAAWYGETWWTQGRFIETTNDAYVGGDITVIAPKVSGFIARIAVSDNQPVHAGDLLIKLDDRDYRAALAKTQAAAAAEQAMLANLDAQRRLQEAMIAQAQAGIAAADAETDRARFDQARYRQLSARADASVQTFQRADADYKQALAGGEKARAALLAAQREIDVIDTEKSQARAALAVAAADRDLAALRLSYTELRAPIDGTVGNRSAQVGSFAAIGAGLISIVPARGLWIDANFKENQLAEMKPGMDATVEADALPGKIFQGHVVSLAPATGAEFSVLPAENATGNFTKIVQRVPVRILLAGDASELGRLRPGLSVTAYVDTRVAEPGQPQP